MIGLLSRIFIKNRDDTGDPAVRRAYGVLCSFVGILFNVLLFVGKYIAGTLSASIAITADAFNNLSDAGSSIITLLGFRLAAQKPDPNHPFGHGRIEYLSGVAVSIIIIVVGFQLGRESLEKIFNPAEVDTGLLPMLILVVSILVKGYMFIYNRSVGRKLNSPGMVATSVDSITDCVATSVVLISMLVMRFTSVNIDGWSGAAVACFIMYSGISAVKSTLSPLLGTPPEPAFVEQVCSIVLSHPEIMNIHDLIVHDYGPGRVMVSLHAEVPGSGDIYELHDAIDRAELELHERLGCSAVIHMDPVSMDDERVSSLREELSAAIAQQVFENISIHDFRIVEGPTHTNVIFDAVLPFDSQISEAEAKNKIEEIVRSMLENAHPHVTIDRPFT